MIAMHEKCDLCASYHLELAYNPPTSTRGLAVFVCKECGLVQSLPRIDHVTSHNVAVSSGADFGNIRYGKGFRTESAITLLTNVLDLRAARNCLDVGANRGSFALRLCEIAPQASVLAIEPDENIVAGYADVPGIELMVSRIEHVGLPEERFDLVYCSHTLEHLSSPRQVLGQIRRAMTRDGVLFVEVPNLDFIGREDVLEEWFIDKHLYHFSQNTLQRYLQITGFRLAEGLSTQDMENITVIAFTTEASIGSETIHNSQLAQSSLDLIKRYQATVCKNQSALQSAVRYIETLASSNRVVVWGAGRIFDSLVCYGGLDVALLTGVVDKYLAAFTEGVYGCPLLGPADLPALSP